MDLMDFIMICIDTALCFRDPDSYASQYQQRFVRNIKKNKLTIKR